MPHLGRRIGASPLTVASVPADHVYVQHLGHPDDGPERARVVRLPDPHPEVPGRLAESRWWPPRMLEPAWIADHPVDVLHLHFGYDDRTPAQLAATVAALVERGVPLVLTVHDLRNPHHDDPATLPRQLDVLLPAAAAVVTLTDGAAAELARGWGVRAEVLPHPHVVAPADILRHRRTTAPSSSARPRVGLSAKSLRRNTDPLRLLPGLLSVAASAAVEVVVDLHHDVHDDPPTPYATRLRSGLDEAVAAGLVTVRVHDRLSDEELWQHLSSLNAVVLPYRFGTHSGWLEAAHDLGVRVVAPTCGQYADQGADHLYAADESQVDVDSLSVAVRAALASDQAPEPAPAYVARRRAQRVALAAAHESLYRRVLAGRS